MRPRKSDAHADMPVRHLRECELADGKRGPFHVHLEPTKERSRGKRVYRDGFGQRVTLP